MTAKTLKYASAAAFAALLAASCYREVDLDGYKEDEGRDLLTLNALVCPDSTVAVAATKTYFFSDSHNERTYVSGLNIELTVDGLPMGPLTYNPQSGLYTSDVRPAEGSEVQICTNYGGKQVWAADVVPAVVPIESVTVERRGPVALYTNNDYVFTYYLTFADDPDAENYYFVQWEEVRAGDNMHIGERDFTHELVFQKLAAQVHATIPGWTPYSPYGLPFSDKGINGKRHTLVLEEIVQASRSNSSWRFGKMERRFYLHAISKAYYDYLLSVLIFNEGNNGLLQGGLIDIGVAEPSKLYTNISDGLGILGCYSTSQTAFDVFDVLGPIPPP